MKLFVSNFSESVFLAWFSFGVVFEGPELFKHVRETNRLRFHRDLSKSVHKAPSYDQKLFAGNLFSTYGMIKKQEHAQKT